MFDLFRSREKTMKYLLTGVLSIVALSMVITLIPGITSPVQTSADDQATLAHVCGATVLSSDVRRQVEDFTKNGQLPAQMVSSYLPVIINSQIELQALACLAQEKGYEVTDQDLANEIRNAMPSLVNASTGEFDKAAYERGVRNMGMTVPIFEERMKQQMLVKRMQDMALEGVFVPPAEVQAEYERRNVKVKLAYAAATFDKLAGKIKPAESDLMALYNNTPGRFTIPEKREYTVAYADQDKIAATISVNEDLLRSAYAKDPDRWRMPDRVKVRHILIMTQGLPDAQKPAMMTKIKDLLKRVKAGEDFGKLATQYSEDPGSKNNGGEYDFQPRGQWVKPFEDAAFSMKVGQISDIVTTDYGYHIIQVMAREDARVKPFEEVKATLATEVQRTQVQTAMQKAIDDARAEVVKTPAQIDAIAKKYHLDVVKTGKLQANQPMPVLGQATSLINAVFAAKQGDITTVQSPQEGKLAFARIDVVEPSRKAEFNEARAQIEAAYIQAKTQEIAQAKIKTAADKLKAGADFNAVAKELGVEVKTSGLIARDGAIEGVGDANAFAELFGKPVGSAIGPVAVMGQYVLAKTIEKVEPDMSKFNEERQTIVDAIKRRMAQERYMLFKDSVMQHLLNKGKIKRNEKAISALIEQYIRA